MIHSRQFVAGMKDMVTRHGSILRFRAREILHLGETDEGTLTSGVSKPPPDRINQTKASLSEGGAPKGRRESGNSPSQLRCQPPLGGGLFRTLFPFRRGGFHIRPGTRT